MKLLSVLDAELMTSANVEGADRRTVPLGGAAMVKLYAALVRLVHAVPLEEAGVVTAVATDTVGRIVSA